MLLQNLSHLQVFLTFFKLESSVLFSTFSCFPNSCSWFCLCFKTILFFEYVTFKLWCRKKGILFVAIDQNRSLSDQGPFDIVLYKVKNSIAHCYCLTVLKFRLVCSHRAYILLCELYKSLCYLRIL